MAAEALFAEQGFTETTMRQITSAADVNLAAVNYHFRSKQGLVNAVCERLMEPLCAEIETALADRLLDSSPVRIEELLEILMRALLNVSQINTYSLSVFMRLLELAYMKNQEELREFFVTEYWHRLQTFLDCLRKDAAPMEDNEFFWRLHFLLGSIVFTLSNYHMLLTLEKSSFKDSAEIERILHRMIPVLAAGMQARGEKIYFSRI
ncbi:putative transcriptional regulator for fatty acid degradation FadQ, TetR family [Nitrincola lacisaponensis]|uniref:Putative transcriptional regulator for fatty acid degradation FadQ, TetR family n=1 Tax=Nitrincola lacisaponensis TaxID=267850 RepID=A0A063XZ30_9GAMM|nr:putative transcriptional regulator for fatty acid degradation FadQ, TetR family [Nitrincola lacisaponensis]